MSQRKFNAYEYSQLNKYGFDPSELSKFVDADIPVEYITGKVDFLGSEFSVNQNVLIPRIETEELIEKAFKDIQNKKQSTPIDFCDIGTGSGAIGISFGKLLLRNKIHFKGFLTDKSKSALKIAYKNAKEIFDMSVKVLKPDDSYVITGDVNKVDTIHIIESDLFNNIQPRKFDIIFANLPYIPTSRIDLLDISVKNYEPLLALDGGADGLEIIRRLLNQAPAYLKKDGVMYLEVDDTHTNPQEFLSEWNIDVVKDSLDKNRFWILHKRKHLDL